jgi:UDP-N-acetyl-D-glucosamine dehydrogenase
LKNLKIQLAGIAYKTNVADIREAPALLLMEKLINYGAIVSWYDPLIEVDVPGKQEKLQTDIDLGLIVTPHKEIDFTEWAKSNTNVLDLSSNTDDYGWPKFL